MARQSGWRYRGLEQGTTLVTEFTEVTEGGWHAAIDSPQGIRLFLWAGSAPDRDVQSGDEPVSGDGPVHFTVSHQIDAPADVVFDAAT